MLRGRRRTRLAAAATVTAAALLLTGCSAHLDAGSAGANKLQTELSRIDGVREVDTDGKNTLPFTGSASATVYTDDHLPNRKVQQITDEVGRWVASHHGATSYSARIDTDGFNFTVADKAKDNAQTLRVVNSLRGDDRWLGASMYGNNSWWDIDLQAKNPADLIPAWTAVQKAAEDSGWDEVDPEASAWNKPAHATAIRYDPDYNISGSDPSVEIRAYQQVSAKHPVTSAIMKTGSIRLHVADSADVADAEATIAAAAPATAALVDGGIIRKSTNSSSDSLPSPAEYKEADRLAAVADRPGVTAIDEKPDWLIVTADGTENALAVADALAAADPQSPMGTIRVGSTADAAEDRGSDGLMVSGTANRLGEAASLGKIAAGYLPARAAAYTDRVTIDGTVQEPSGAGTFARALEPALVDGDSFTVDVAGDEDDDNSVTFTVSGGALTVEEPFGYATPGSDRDSVVTAVQDAWQQ